MFTGIIQDIGTLVSAPGAGGGRLAVATALATGDLGDIRLGDSIAVHGPCLTVVEHARGRLVFDVSPETLRRSSLGGLGHGARVHLERALRLSDRLDGHIVQGHVDGVGRLVTKSELGAGAGWELEVELPAELLPYVVPKGSIALDGVSLTVATLVGARAGVAVVPHTAKNTTLAAAPIGAAINVETDVLGRYVARLMGFADPRADRGQGGGLSLDALARAGFLDR
ncbi:MAG: riboflavin synthase [Deltaproteobacteria bacterium]|nr:riboflavin synthase [Deltaproteobacteria bacterium]